MPVIRRFKPTVLGVGAASQPPSSTSDHLPVGPGPPHAATQVAAAVSPAISSPTPKDVSLSAHAAGATADSSVNSSVTSPSYQHHDSALSVSQNESHSNQQLDYHQPLSPVRKRPTSISLSVSLAHALSPQAQQTPAVGGMSSDDDDASTTASSVHHYNKEKSLASPKLPASSANPEPLRIRRTHHVSQSALQENLMQTILESPCGSPSPAMPLNHGSAAATGSASSSSLPKSAKRGLVLSRPVELPNKEDIVVEKLKMRDFLRFNPDGSPMRWRRQFVAALQTNDADEAEKAAATASILQQSSGNIKDRLRAASTTSGMTSPIAPPPTSSNSGLTGTPRVRLGESGEAIINEESLIIDTTGPRPDPTKVSHVGAVHEELESATTYTTYAKYRRKGRAHGRRWSKDETARFFVALRCCGLDFSMISKFFPEREERELRNKFKAEDRRNPDVVTKFLTGGGDVDAAYDPLALLATSMAIKNSEQAGGSTADEPKKKRKKQPNSNSSRGEGMPRGRGPKVRLTIGEDSVSSDSGAGSEVDVDAIKRPPSKRKILISESSSSITTNANASPITESQPT